MTLERWTELYGERAQAEGWGLFSVSTFDGDRTMLQRDDEANVFACDEHVLAFVYFSAQRRMPNDRHVFYIQALEILAAQDCACVTHGRGCPGEDCDACYDCQAGAARTCLTYIEDHWGDLDHFHESEEEGLDVYQWFAGGPPVPVAPPKNPKTHHWIEQASAESIDLALLTDIAGNALAECKYCAHEIYLDLEEYEPVWRRDSDESTDCPIGRLDPHPGHKPLQLPRTRP